MRRAAGLVSLAVLLLAAASLVGVPAVDAAPARYTFRAQVGENLVAVLDDEHKIFLEAVPDRGEGLYAFCRRLARGPADAPTVAAENGGLEDLEAGVRYRLPYEVLGPETKVAVARALFRNDSSAEDGWRHSVHPLGAVPTQSLWHVAEWFTGNGENYRRLRQVSGLSGEDLRPGDVVIIPADLLLPAFRGAVGRDVPTGAPEPMRTAELPPAVRMPPGSAPTSSGPPSAAVEPAVADVRPAHTGSQGGSSGASSGATAAVLKSPAGTYRLEYDQDSEGPHAVYRLQAGEALYSSVVVRFTGRLIARDVNALAEEIARRSGIADVTDIAVGYRIKIPLDLLLPEYLPPGDPRRQEYEAARAASAQFGNTVRALDLSGITVILDAGHGGRDSGATFAGIWESLYVYDIMLRVRHLLATYTAADVRITIQDGDRVLPLDQDTLPFSRGHRVLTSPPYAIEEAVIGTNLRWYLSNSIYRSKVREGDDPEKMVFLSLHADSLHPSVRGAMVYIPDAQLRQGSFGKSGGAYQARAEVREQPRVSFSWQSRVQSEGLSRDLADRIIDGFRAQGLPIHPFKPVREKIIRRRSEYVPAVLRYNEVPAKVLVEVCNLANDQDRKLLLTRSHRQKMAEAIVSGLLSYYGYEDQIERLQVAAASGK